MRLSIGTAWDETKSALARNRRLVVPVALGLILVPAVVSAMVEPRTAPGEQPEAGWWMAITLVMVILMLVGQMAIVLLSSGWQGSVGEAIRRSLRRLPTLIFAALIVMVPLILFLTLLVALIGMSAADASLSAASLSPTGWLVLLIGFLAIFAVSVRLIPLVVLVASEDLGPVATLKRAVALTSGHFWKLLAFVLLAVLAFVVAAAAVGVVIGSLISLALGQPEPWSVSLLLLALAAGLVQAAFVTLYTAMLARITSQLSAGSPGVPEVGRAK